MPTTGHVRSGVFALILMMCLESQAQVSYWFSQWQKKGNAQDAQEFFMWPGTNIYFSYASNHVIINGTGTNVVISTATNSLYAQYATNWLGSNAFYVLILGSTNAWSTNSLYSLWSTNWTGSNDLWIIMTNAIYNATNGFVSGGQTNIYATNLIGLLEGTNITFTTNASGYLSINGASGAGPTILDIRTNAFNYFLGTNSFTNDVYLAWNQSYLGAPSFMYGGAKWGLGCTNVQSTAFLPYAGVIRGLPSGSLTDAGGRYLCFGISENFATGWFDDAFVPNFFYGAGFSARSENDGVEKGVFLAGSPVCIGGRTTASTPVYFMQSGRPAAGMTSTGNLFSGRNWSPGQLFGTSAGGIFATNFMHTLHYSRAMRGFVVNSNAWATLAWSTPPNFQIAGSGDSFSYGDMWMLSSNGVPTFVWKDIAGTVHTNQIPQTTSLTGDATGIGTTSIAATVTNIQPPIAGTIGDVLTKTATGVEFVNSVAVSGSVTASNGLYYLIHQTNSTANTGYTNVWQPAHSFASMMMYTTNAINGGANTYAIITNYTTARSNLMGCSLTTGYITNTISGFYRVGVHLSGVALDNSATVEGDLLLNGVVKDEVSFVTVFDNPPRVKGMSAIGILYITNNTPITFQVKSSGASGLSILRAQMVIGSP